MWELKSFLLECLHFAAPAHVTATVKRVIVLQGLMSVRAAIRLQFIIVEEKGWNRSVLAVRGCNIRVPFGTLN